MKVLLLTFLHLPDTNWVISKDKPINFERTYMTYNYIVKSGKDEPLTTQADRFNTNMAFSIGSYVKGQIFLSQLGSIIGDG